MVAGSVPLIFCGLGPLQPANSPDAFTINVRGPATRIVDSGPILAAFPIPLEAVDHLGELLTGAVNAIDFSLDEEPSFDALESFRAFGRVMATVLSAFHVAAPTVTELWAEATLDLAKHFRPVSML